MRPETFERLRRIGLALALFALASCGGGGGDSGPPGSKLFITDGGNHTFISIINPAPNPNSPNLTLDRIVQGVNTGLGVPGGTPSISSIPSIALDAANDRLFASTQTSLVVFDGAGSANGNTQSSRRITATYDIGGGPRGVNFYALYLNTTNNILYVADLTGDVHAFNSASTRNGATTPDRTVTPNLGTTQVLFPFGIAVDKVRDLLYVGIVPSGSPAFMIVFNGASTANTNTAPNQSRVPDRTFVLPGAGSFHLDEATDRLYVSRFDGVVWVFDNASGLTSVPTQNRTIDLFLNLTGRTQPFIFVDTSRNKLYAVGNDPGGTFSRFFIIDNASTADEPNVTGILATITATNIRLSAVAVKP